MKGPDPQKEMEETERISESAGMVFTACRAVRLPGSDSLRKNNLQSRFPLIFS